MGHGSGNHKTGLISQIPLWHKETQPPAFGNADGCEIISGRSPGRTQSGLAPVAAHPDVAVSPPAPVTGRPHRAPTRGRTPAAAHPYPGSAPFPCARDPDKRHVRLGRHDFDLRGRRLVLLGHDDRVRRRGGLLHHHDPAGRRALNDTTGQQRQADGDEQGFGEYGFFHNHHQRRR